MISGMIRLPLPALLSSALVAFTIEFDNEAERQLPHRTTRQGASGRPDAPWLVSLAMWANCMQFVEQGGITVRELERRARTRSNLPGMVRWGYIVIKPDPADRRAKPPKRDWVVAATPAGRQARETWSRLAGTIERCWKNRFGRNAVGRLRRAIEALAAQLDRGLPDCLPILGYGLECREWENQRRIARQHSNEERSAADKQGALPDLPLSALLSRPLLAWAMEFERQSGLSLAIGANWCASSMKGPKSWPTFRDCLACRRKPFPWGSACCGGGAWPRSKRIPLGGPGWCGSQRKGSERARNILS
jgi:hypothetical protein